MLTPRFINRFTRRFSSDGHTDRIVRVLTVLLITLITGCTSFVPARQPTEGAEFERRCAPPSQTAAFSLQADTGDPPPRSAEQSERFSKETLSIAEVLEVTPLLRQLSNLERQAKRHTVQFIEARQGLTDRLFLALFEINGMVAEITCERDRTDQVADKMDEIDASTVRNLTLASVLVSGAASIVTGAVGLAAGASVPADASSVGGGVFASIFGGTALFTKSQHVFRHERNLLKDLWEDTGNPTFFSPTVWRYLHTPRLDRPGTPRDDIVKAWRQQGRLGEPESKDEEQRKTLFFGKGGVYTASDLRGRASMLETLEASVRLINEHLELFIREVMFKGETS